MGWATGASLHTGRRRRTEYTITPQGATSLKQWLATEPTTFVLEFEHLVRVYLAAFGTPADLLQTMQSAAARANEMVAIAEHVIAGYEAGVIEGPRTSPTSECCSSTTWPTSPNSPPTGPQGP